VIWAILQVGGRQLTSLLIFAILGVLLPPRDFGLIGMAMAWLTVIQGASDLGLGAALVQRREIGSAHFSTVFFLNLGVGAALTVVGVLLAWPSAWFFHEPGLRPIASALSLTFLLASLSAAQTAVAQRELRFRQLAIRDITASAIGGGVGIAAALSGAGAWSLVLQTLVTGAAAAALIWPLSRWRPRVSECSTLLLRELWPYSSQLFAFNVFKAFVQNLDRILLGHLLGPVALGLYVFSFRFVVQPIATVAGAVGSYLFPFFSRQQDNRARLRRGYGSALKGLAVLTCPVAVLAAAASPTLVPALWGEQWRAAVPLMQIMAALAVCQAYASPVGQLFKSLDRPNWLLWWSIGITAVVAVLLVVGVRLAGLPGAVVGVTVAYLAGSVVIFRSAAHLLSFRLPDLWRTCGSAIVAALGMAAASVALARVAAGPGWWQAVTVTLVPLAVYALVLLAIDRRLYLTLAARVRAAGPSGDRP
jgi:O-antigen/teichoic acid export membrane protein